MSALLEVAGVSYGYGERQVLRQVVLSVARGEAAALIGPNGAGKTTLLRLIAGALSATEGRITLAGREVQAMERRERARMVAVVPQQFDLPFEYTVEQVVEQGRTPHLEGWRGLLRGMDAADRAAVERALELADVAGMRGRIFNELSGGERQRVKIALALAQEPRLLLLDEPTQNLDIGRQMELMRVLAALRAEGITVLASIHELHLVRGNFTAVHLLHGPGELSSGTAEQMLTQELLSAAFRCDLAAVDLGLGVD